VTVQPPIEAINAGGPMVRLVVPGFQGAKGFQVLSGSGVPANGLGVDGDFYVNTGAWTIYGPRTGGSWGSPTSLIGPQGIQGIQGIQGPPGTAGLAGNTVLNGSGAPSNGLGTNGDFYINTGAGTIYGPKAAGAWGSPTNLIGPQGIQGIQGIQGVAGLDGKTVRSGSGAPSGDLGVNGDFYINTSNWTIYGPKTAGAWGSPSSLTANADAAQATANAALTAAANAAPPGSVAYVARSTAPTGWLKANGAAISRTTYADLFGAIGGTYGAGDGSTTFNLPDLRGEFLRAFDDGRGLDAGRGFGSVQGGMMADHQHTTYSSALTSWGLSGWLGDRSQNNAFCVLPYNINANPGFSTVANASSGAYNAAPAIGSETRPRNVALLAVIKF
jgi:microcystin-dependent protein